MVDTAHHYIVEFSQEEIDKAKKIRKQENNIPGKQHFLWKNRWVGKLGEWAVEASFPKLQVATKDYSSEKFDFYSPETLYQYEVKTRASSSPYKDHYDFLVNRKQHKQSPADIYIGCYYLLGSGELRIVGWLWKNDVDEVGNLLNKGDMWGKYKVSADRYGIPYKKLNGLADLPG